MRRREFLASAGAVGMMTACVTNPPDKRLTPGPCVALPPVQLSADRIIKITVCTRPCRAQGPRLDVEQIGTKTVVHNYGHAGAGWSLSWGSSTIATRNALATGQRQFAVIGCGALGLTSATLLQRAGAQVTIYAKDLPPQTRSTFATGTWGPDSRLCQAAYATPAFKQRWQEMARISHLAYTDLLGLPGHPVEYFDRYILSDVPFNQSVGQDGSEPVHFAQDPVQFAQLENELIPELITQTQDLPPGSSQFPIRYARRSTEMMFNITAYQRLLVDDFVANGGKIVQLEFYAPSDFSRLKESALINCTGFGARALLNDQSITPVRGQLTRLIPDERVRYGWFYKNVMFVPRRDGFVVQDGTSGWNDTSIEPNRAEAERAVAVAAQAAPRASPA